MTSSFNFFHCLHLSTEGSRAWSPLLTRGQHLRLEASQPTCPRSGDSTCTFEQQLRNGGTAAKLIFPVNTARATHRRHTASCTLRGARRCHLRQERSEAGVGTSHSNLALPYKPAPSRSASGERIAYRGRSGHAPRAHEAPSEWRFGGVLPGALETSPRKQRNRAVRPCRLCSRPKRPRLGLLPSRAATLAALPSPRHNGC